MNLAAHTASMAETIAFAILSAGVLAGGIMTITRRNPVSAVMSLVLSFAALAGLFATLSAHFLAVLQILVYAGAIMVLFVFVVMIVNREEDTPIARQGLVTRAVGVLAAGYVFYRVAWLVGRERSVPLLAASAAPPVKDFGTVSSVGALLFSDFLFPFEAISLLLLVAVIGGVMLTRHLGEDRSSRVS
ncbi:MAG TPA: NADH-quinone oxidoreductase subunit J [Polyangia bacterium]|jgi:NADH-quinone oxidoreductase subunit J|nr:NADH-quinone oxidoreductase subunit J [Polyangia bacterium]